jgi:hypothetical protein
MAGFPPKPRENEKAQKNRDYGRTRKPGIPGTVGEPEKWEYPKREGGQESREYLEL